MIIFRADGNSTVGLGHIMRCLSIADAFKIMGENCLFITAGNGLCELIQARGHGHLALPSEYNHMDDEIERFEKEITTFKHAEAIFVDSYFVTPQYLKELYQFCTQKNITLVYIDDILAFDYPCNILLNYNIYASLDAYKKLYKKSQEPIFLLGTAYVPLRGEFQNLPDRVVKTVGTNILISTGGADFEHIGLEIIKSIISHKERGRYVFHFIVGMMNKDRDSICSLAEGRENIILYQNVKQMSKLMRFCDVAISAAGSTLYELCSTQTPAITYIVADNQMAGAYEFERRGIFQCAGDIRELGRRTLAEKVLDEAVRMTEDFLSRCIIAEKMKALVDGNGARRVRDRVLEV